jgi:DNA-binding NarL/FixJ family response regulator
MDVSTINEDGPTSFARTYRIMVVDDHPLVREGYVQLLSSQANLKICGVAESIEQALAVLQDAECDLMVVDLNLKDGSGLELIREIRTFNKQIKILVVSVHAELLFAERVLRAGANGYINKRIAIEHLITAMQKVLDGEVYLSPKMSQRLGGKGGAVGGGIPSDGSQIAKLSDRELEVFQQLGEGASTKRIARLLKISPKTVDRHRENIKHKLNLAHANDLIRFATTWVNENR